MKLTKKYPNFTIKLAAFIIIAGILAYYQTVAAARAEIVAENEAKIAEIEEYNQEVQLENAKRQADNCFYENGTYEGEGTGYGGPIRVSVTVEYDILTDVHVISHDGEDPAYYQLAEGLTDEMLSRQSTDVDAASGATFSSRGIIDAANNALEQAVKQ